MTRRLTAMGCATMLLIAAPFQPTQAHADKFSIQSLKGITALTVIVESLPSGVKSLGITEESIQTDVELKLRLAGMRVVTQEESFKIVGSPYLYVYIDALDDARAASVEVQLHQNVILERNGESVIGADTWRSGVVGASPTGPGLRGITKDLVDEFLNDWLSVNPKKL